MMRRALVVVACLAAPALAETKKTQPPSPTPPADHKEGEYGGVVPGQPQLPAGKPKKPAAKGTLSWMGFEARDGGAVVFLQSPAAFELAQHVEGATLVVNLTGVVRLGHNVWRPIDTRFFETPIARIAARPIGAARATKTAPAHGAGVEIRVTFKSAKDAKEGALHTATEADGLYYAYLSFAKVDAAATGGATKDPEQ